MTTQTARNQPTVPRLVHGPLSIPRIWIAVHHQPTPARANSSATSPSRARAAANAGARPAPPGTRAGAETVMGSGCPRELGRREPGLPLVLDAEGVDLRALRLRHCQVGRHRVEHAWEANRLAGLDTEGHHVFDLE